MDTDSLYLAIAEKELENYIRPEMKAEWERLRSKDFTDIFYADSVGFCFLESVAPHTKKNMTTDNLVSSNRSADVERCYVYVARLTAAKILPPRRY